MSRIPKEKAIELLSEELNTIPFLKMSNYYSARFKQWQRNAEVLILHVFGKDSTQIKEFTNIRGFFAGVTGDIPFGVTQEDYLNSLEEASGLLESMIDEIKRFWKDEDTATAVPNIPTDKKVDSKKIFIVHGRDDGAKETLARFISKLDLDPIILHEQSNQGLTIIEKFEKHANVGFAIALLTPDDIGGLKEKSDEQNPRARQNVIFEFGYFMGKLGRANVCALVKGHIERPSDSDGIVYISMDNNWKMELVKELKAAGYEIDANRVFSA